MLMLNNLINNIKNCFNLKIVHSYCVNNKINIQLLDILCSHSVVLNYQILDNNKIKFFPNLNISNKIRIKKVSKPSKRVSITIEKLNMFNPVQTIGILSTNKGLLSNIEAKAKNIGGVLVLLIYFF